jgi:hypothetical protein
MVVGVFHLTHQIEVTRGSSRPASSRRAPPGSPPSRAAISNRRFSLKHFRFARGIRCE